MVGQTPVNTRTGEIVKMDELPNKIVVFRHALRLLPIVFKSEGDYDGSSLKQYMYDCPSLKLHICRTLISASAVLGSPSTESMDHNKLARLEKLLKRGTLSGASENEPGLSILQAKSESQTIPVQLWNNGSTKKLLTGLNYNALNSATRALAASLGYDSNSDFFPSAQGEANYSHIQNELIIELSAGQNDWLNQSLWTSIYKKGDDPKILQKYELEPESPKKEDMWSFWREWYAAFLVGKPVDWSLQSQVAFIPDEIWDSGVDSPS